MEVLQKIRYALPTSVKQENEKKYIKKHPQLKK